MRAPDEPAIETLSVSRSRADDLAFHLGRLLRLVHRAQEGPRQTGAGIAHRFRRHLRLLHPPDAFHYRRALASIRGRRGQIDFPAAVSAIRRKPRNDPDAEGEMELLQKHRACGPESSRRPQSRSKTASDRPHFDRCGYGVDPASVRCDVHAGRCAEERARCGQRRISICRSMFRRGRWKRSRSVWRKSAISW